MPGKVKVKIISGRNLPVMDRSSDTTDAYVEIKLGSTTYKTDVCRKSLHPQWNSDWYRFELDDSELQDEPLQIRLMDHDTYSANDAIGKVYLDLNPLLLPAASTLHKWNRDNSSNENSTNAVMSGWIPVYDTMHGIRGEVNVVVKVELFSDFNKFRQSSCGVQFFCSPSIPQGYYAQIVHGFVEELVVNDDPEYQWIDKIRTPRASNEARQTLFFKLSGELQRKIGVKALDLGGNAVIGYIQSFDLEGESGIVARGIGTAVTLVKVTDMSPQPTEYNLNEERALNYLKFLGSARSFFLKTDYPVTIPSNEPITVPSPLPSPKRVYAKDPPAFCLSAMPQIDKEFTPQASPPLYHSSSLQTLLKQEDMRGTPAYGLTQKFRNLKYALKSKLTDSRSQEQMDLSGLLDAKKSKTFKYRRTQSDSTGMAEILVRSVFQAGISLDKIAETRDTSPARNIVVHIEEEPEDLESTVESSTNLIAGSYKSLVESGSCSSSSAESSDSDEDDDDDDDEPSDAKDVEPDTVSHIVETIRKLSMINPSHIHPYISKASQENICDVKEETETTMFQIGCDEDDDIDVEPIKLATPPAENTCEPILFQDFAAPVKHTNLVETAMQTILFDKVNILGACTPPHSPRAILTPPVRAIDRRQFFFPPNVLKRNETAQSLCDADITKTGFLGTKFTSLHNIHDASAKVNTYCIHHGKEVILPSNDDITMTDTDLNGHNAEPHGMLALLKKRKDQIFRVPKLLFQRLDSKIHHNKDDNSHAPKEGGLLTTALGNVLIDSVNEILATSHSETPAEPNSEAPTNPLAPLISTNNSSTICRTSGVNTEIDQAKFSESTNTLLACLTPSLRIETTVQLPSEVCGVRTEAKCDPLVQRTQSPAKLNSIPCIHRRSSDSDLSITPKGNSLTGSDRSGGCTGGQLMRNNAIVRSTVPQENFDIMEYPFLTMSKYPPGFVCYLGGAVSARSVKLLERITNLEEPESRDTWWSEIRMEIRSHARALNCNAVLGYIETTSICDDVCVLSASGTAAVIGYQYPISEANETSTVNTTPTMKQSKEITTSTSSEKSESERDKPTITAQKQVTLTPEKEQIKLSCAICHLPYVNCSVSSSRTSVSVCAFCRSAKVPDVLIATIEMPEGTPNIGRGCFLQSYVCRPLRDLRGESNAKEISDGLPFLEYELHRLLINKLKVKGMNSIFGLKVRISIGERLLIGIATGTAIYLSPLPAPPLPKLVSDRTTDEKKLAHLQKLLHDTVKKNKEIYQIKSVDETQNGRVLSDDEPEEEKSSLDLLAGNKDCCILEVDDPEDIDVLNSLMEPRPPDGFHVVNTELVPGLEELEIVKNLQMFTQIWRAKLQAPYNVDKHFNRLLQSVYFKLRRMVPCALCDLQFRVDSPEPDEIQLCVLGMALGLGDPQKNFKLKRKPVGKKIDDDLIFNLDEDQIPEQGMFTNNPPNYLTPQNTKYRQKSPNRGKVSTRQRHVPYRERHGVDITPLCYVPGGKIERYLGNLNFFFIRETTSIREEGGLSGFVHSFATEVLAIVRAHVTALGGNAMVAYFITECVLNHNLHKNQGQCLINVGGDVVFVSYFNEDSIERC